MKICYQIFLYSCRRGRLPMNAVQGSVLLKHFAVVTINLIEIRHSPWGEKKLSNRNIQKMHDFSGKPLSTMAVANQKNTRKTDLDSYLQRCVRWIL